MRRLKKHSKRVDTLRSEARPRKRGRIGRIVYLLFLLGLVVLLFDIFVGELLYLRGQGMVTRDVAVISPGYRGTVRELSVEEGDRVAAGDRLMGLHSQRMTTDIAQLSGDLANVEAQLAKLQTRREKLKTLLPAARERMDKIAQFRKQIEDLGRARLANNAQIASILTDSFHATRDFQELQTDAETVATELRHTRNAAERVRTALREMRTIYSGGRVEAPRTGLVGRIDVKPGSGIQPGDRVAEIFHGERYVLAYVPTGAIYDVRPGDKVALRYGFRLMQGRIDALLPLAHRLPSEFQRAFQTAERKQLVRIRIAEDGRVPPLFTKVAVTWRSSGRVLAIRGVQALSRAVVAGVDWIENRVETTQEER